MDIRDTKFWKNLAPIFSIEPDENTPRNRGKPGARFCDETLLLDRFHQAINRAKHNNRNVLLLLVRLGDVGNGGALDNENEARLINLAMRRLGRCLRSVDTICSHGNRLIAILLEELLDSTPIPLVVEKIHSILQHPFSFEENDIRFLPTSAASLFPADGNSADLLWAQAELTLDKACEEIPGSYRFSPVVTGHVAMERFELTRELHRAYRNEEFSLVYQPVLDMAGQVLKGIEVLVRWQHPTRGELQPREFLHLLEESGLIVPVGEYILSEACQFSKRLSNAGHGSLRFCFNISARQLADPGFLFAILDALYDADLDPKWLQLEFPQMLLEQFAVNVDHIFPKLNKAGIRIAIDHFAGHSVALNNLQQLPVSIVKVECSLLDQVEDNSDLKTAIANTLEQAKAMGIRFAVVGVETDVQLSQFREMGFTEIQGKLFCPPLEKTALESWLSNLSG